MLAKRKKEMERKLSGDRINRYMWQKIDSATEGGCLGLPQEGSHPKRNAKPINYNKRKCGLCGSQADRTQNFVQSQQYHTNPLQCYFSNTHQLDPATSIRTH